MAVNCSIGREAFDSPCWFILGVQKVRVAFVGYRDYNDTDRIVKCDFRNNNDVEAILTIIRGQEATGG